MSNPKLEQNKPRTSRKKKIMEQKLMKLKIRKEREINDTKYKFYDNCKASTKTARAKERRHKSHIRTQKT